MTKLKASTQFINVVVKVTGSAPNYTITTAPATPYITQQDTVINYQLYDTGSKNIVFTGAIVEPDDQLAYSVSISGKLLTLSDANTKAGPLSITFELQDEDGYQFKHDPQVHNDPEV